MSKQIGWFGLVATTLSMAIGAGTAPNVEAADGRVYHMIGAATLNGQPMSYRSRVNSGDEAPRKVA